jgi:hypothetical protein
VVMPIVPTTTKDRAEFMDSKADRDWLNPISMSKLQKAVKVRAKTVELNGNDFNIEYGIMWKSKVLEKEYECICLRRKDGCIVPFGYISVKRILDFRFEK